MELNPTSGNWNTTANWTPVMVPNGPTDVATSSLSNTTAIGIANSDELDQIAFDLGANAFTVSW